MNETPALRAQGVRVTLARVEVLRGVDLALPKGAVTGVLGPSGAGKSTLFKVISGELVPRAGRVELLGEDVTRLPLWKRARRGLGYVPQTPSVLIDLTVEENLRTFETLAPNGTARGPKHWAEVAELRERMSVRAGALSGGERRRLEIIRALIAAPSVLVCDEPFAGIDPAGAERTGQLLRALARAGTAVVLADHHVEEALGVCDRALLLLDGTIVLEGQPEQFREHSLVQGRYLGTWHRTIPPRARQG